MHALLLHNPEAGSGRYSCEEIRLDLEAAGFSTRCMSIDDDAFKAALAEGDMEIVIVAGGDGTIAKVVRHLPNRKVRLAVLPTGTANNVARSLAIKGAVPALIANLREAPEQRLDVGSASGPWGRWNFLESVGWGALAQAVATGVPRNHSEQRVPSGRALFAEILEAAQPSHVRIDIDGHAVEGDFIFVEILNIGITGPRVIISPSAQPGDGLLDIVSLPAARKRDMIAWLRSHPDDRSIPLTEIKAKTAILYWRDRPLRIDAVVFNPPERETPVVVAIEPHGLHVSVPQILD
jgi:diacylglycerol kinase (ATP)